VFFLISTLVLQEFVFWTFKHFRYRSARGLHVRCN